MTDAHPKVIIDLRSIEENFNFIKATIGKDVTCSAVVKSDSYGLGAVVVSKKLYSAGCRDFWVSYFVEAIELRNSLPKDTNIFMLQSFDESQIDVLKKENITPVINTIDEFKQINGHDIKIVLHFDTGINRLGIRAENVDEIVSSISDNTDIYFVVSHLSVSDVLGHELNKNQLHLFEKIIEQVKSIRPNVKTSLSASGGVQLGSQYLFDMVRIGGYLYGVNALKSIQKPKNVVSVSSKVLQRYDINKGTTIGYGAYEAPHDMTLAVISIGYADGMMKSLSNSGYVLFNDPETNTWHRAKITGAISMELLVCDVSNIPSHLTARSSDAWLICDSYTINDMARDAGTIPYEILTDINYKSPRIEVIYQD